MKMQRERNVMSTAVGNHNMKKAVFVGSSWEWTHGFHI